MSQRSAIQLELYEKCHSPSFLLLYYIYIYIYIFIYIYFLKSIRLRYMNLYIDMFVMIIYILSEEDSILNGCVNENMKKGKIMINYEK